MRRPRYKSPEEVFYHLITRVAGSTRYYPLQKPAARNKLLELLDFESVQECLLYIELNGLRAELVSTPGQWEAGSAYARLNQSAHQLIDLEKIFPTIRPDLVLDYYQFLLHFRAGLPTDLFETALGERVKWILHEQEPGRYRRRHRFFVDGLAVSRQQEPIRDHIEILQNRGQSRNRKNPAEQIGGEFYTVREQRSNFRG